tara:strand:+ start:6342 stop:7277 length:936 start_codon:yes stop_codon:yes gene_type:complete
MNRKVYLVKRNVDFTDKKFIVKRKDKKKGFSESMLNGNPLSSKFSIGDIVYIYENNNGIWAYGEIIEISEILRFDNIHQIIDFANQRKLDLSWVYTKLINKLHNKKENSFVTFQEYFVNQSLLSRVIPLIDCLKDLRGQTPIRKLNESQIEYLKSPKYLKETKLLKDIPSRLRIDIYSFFSRNYKKLSHLIDIDHFVPQSVGGPGNIIENLVPIGFSLNRYKSDSIPEGLFKVASKNIQLKKFTNFDFNSSSGFIRNNNVAKKNAIKITSYINNLNDIDKAKHFYKQVIKEHYKEYIEIIEDYNKKKIIHL